MDYRINKSLGVRVWHYEDGVAVGLYQKIRNNPGTKARAAVAFERNPDGSCSLVLNEDVLKQAGIDVKTVSWGTIENYIDPAKPKIIVSDIIWDASKKSKLPGEVTIYITPDTAHLLENIDGYAEGISDYLSDLYGYCVKGFTVTCEGTEEFTTKKKGA